MSIPIWQQQVDRELDRVRTASNHYDNIVSCRQPPVETLHENGLHVRCPDCGLESALTGPSDDAHWLAVARDTWKAKHVFNKCRALRAKGLL